VAVAPALRPFEFALPDAATGGARFLLGARVVAGVAIVVHRIAAAHQRRADVGNAAGRTDRQRAVIAVLPARAATDAALRDQRGEAFFRRLSAGPCARLSVAAGLRQFGCVDAGKADALALCDQRVAIDDADGDSHARDDGRGRVRGNSTRLAAGQERRGGHERHQRDDAAIAAQNI
jgi:hypothetical protein